MRQEYDTIVESLASLAEGKETNIAIRNFSPGPTKYDHRYVRAFVTSQPEELPDGDVLWIRFSRGMLHPKPWAIKILEDLGPYQPQPLKVAGI